MAPIALDIQADGDQKALSVSLGSVITAWTQVDTGANVSVTAAGSITMTGTGSPGAAGAYSTNSISTTTVDFVQYSVSMTSIPGSAQALLSGIRATTGVGSTQVGLVQIVGGVMDLGVEVKDTGIALSPNTSYTIRHYLRDEFFFNAIITIQGGAYTNETMAGIAYSALQSGVNETSGFIQFQTVASGVTTTVSNVRTGTVTLSAVSSGDLPGQAKTVSRLAKRLKSKVSL